MKAVSLLKPVPGRPKIPTAPQLRERIAEWMRFGVIKHGIRSQVEMAGALETSGATISRVLRAVDTPGLDTFIRLRFYLPESADRMIASDPPWEDVGGRQRWVEWAGHRMRRVIEK
jgi:hypothetical protein